MSDALHHPSWLTSWWIDLPFRQRWWWREALFESGEGWLKWKHDYRSRTSYDPPDHEEWPVYPPAKRAWFLIHWILQIPHLMIHEHFSWEEARPWFGVLRADPERKKELWR